MDQEYIRNRDSPPPRRGGFPLDKEMDPQDTRNPDNPRPDGAVSHRT
jgi:hypothetical protein